MEKQQAYYHTGKTGDRRPGRSVVLGDYIHRFETSENSTGHLPAARTLTQNH